MDRRSFVCDRDSRSVSTALFVALNDDLHNLIRIISAQNELQVFGRDLALCLHPRPYPVNQSLPVLLAHQDHRKMMQLPGLDQHERLEELVQCSETTGEN